MQGVACAVAIGIRRLKVKKPGLRRASGVRDAEEFDAQTDLRRRAMKPMAPKPASIRA